VSDPLPPAPAPRARLVAEPGRFSLDQAATLAAPGGDPLALRYRSAPRLAHPTGEVTETRPDRGEITVTGFGLIGSGGALPRHHTATVAAELRKRSGALHRFLDMLASRFIGLFVLAGAKYRPTRDPAPAERVLAAAVGLGTPQLAPRAGAPLAELLYHAGHLASRTRSTTRLAAMLEEETGHRVTIEEFAGAWIRLPPSERTRLGGSGRGAGAEGQHAALGMGAVIGAESWDPQARFVIRLGPLDRTEFEAVLPGRPGHDRLVSLARLFVGLDTSFVIAPVLRAPEIPPLALDGGARLGWSSWLTAPRPRRHDGTEPRFEGAHQPA